MANPVNTAYNPTWGTGNERGIVPRRNLNGDIDWRISARPTHRTSADYFRARDDAAYGEGMSALDWLRANNRDSQAMGMNSIISAARRMAGLDSPAPAGSMNRQDLEDTAFQQMQTGGITRDQYTRAIRGLHSGDSVNDVRSMLSNAWRGNMGLPVASAAVASPVTAPTSPGGIIPRTISSPYGTASISTPVGGVYQPQNFGNGMSFGQWLQTVAAQRQEPVYSMGYAFNPISMARRA